MTTLTSRAYAALSWSCDVAGASHLDYRCADDAQLQEYLIAASVAHDLTLEEWASMEYPPIPASRWPALRRLVRVRRIIWAAYDVFGFLARLGAYWLARSVSATCCATRRPSSWRR